MWSHEEYESILLNYPDGVKKIDRSVQSKLFNQNRYNRYRMGHPSGFIEAFSNMYEDIAKDFIKKKINTYLTIIMPLKALSFSNFVLNPIKKKMAQKYKNMKALIIGCGAIGGHLAHCLCENGFDVFIIAKKDSYQKIKKDGLKIQINKNKKIIKKHI